MKGQRRQLLNVIALTKDDLAPVSELVLGATVEDAGFVQGRSPNAGVYIVLLNRTVEGVPRRTVLRFAGAVGAETGKWTFSHAPIESFEFRPEKMLFTISLSGGPSIKVQTDRVAVELRDVEAKGRAKRIGRPTKPPKPRERIPLGLRVTPEMKRKLEMSARSNVE